MRSRAFQGHKNVFDWLFNRVVRLQLTPAPYWMDPFLQFMQWFFDSVSAGMCLPEDGYVVTPPPPPAEPGLAVVYSQPWAVALNNFEPSMGLSNTLLKGCQVSGTWQLVMPTTQCRGLWDL